MSNSTVPANCTCPTALTATEQWIAIGTLLITNLSTIIGIAVYEIRKTKRVIEDAIADTPANTPVGDNAV